MLNDIETLTKNLHQNSNTTLVNVKFLRLVEIYKLAKQIQIQHLLMLN